MRRSEFFIMLSSKRGRNTISAQGHIHTFTHTYIHTYIHTHIQRERERESTFAVARTSPDDDSPEHVDEVDGQVTEGEHADDDNQHPGDVSPGDDDRRGTDS